MSPDEREFEGDTAAEAGGGTQTEAPEEQAEDKQRIELDVKIDNTSACERHMTVTIPREDVDRYYEEAYSEMMPSASVPGFRAGRAPRKLVEHRYRKEATEQVKGSLLRDSLAQISEEQSLTAISEPEFDLDAVEVPSDGPMTFEFDLEVRPEFDLPEWKGLKLERPVQEFGEEDVDRRLASLLTRSGQLVPHEGAAEPGDFLTANVRCEHNGRTLATAREQVIQIRPVLSFHDGKLERFDKLMKGVAAGETRAGEVELTSDAANEELRGEKVRVNIEVLDVKKLKLPELTPQFLEEMGGFESEQDLRDLIRKDLERQLEYRQQQQARSQITATLTAKADWELPPGLLRRQSERELERAVLDLRRHGFSDEEIRAQENEIRQNSAASTARALKEHFILERIAEEEGVAAAAGDFDEEIAMIAAQSGGSVRRVRAQLEKRDLMDSLRNQIIERKVLSLVTQEAKFKDVPLAVEERDEEAIDLATGGAAEPSGAVAEATQGGATP